MRILCQLILWLFRWKIKGAEALRLLPKFVVAIGPHTSNWDFPLGLLVRSASGLTKIRYIGKSSLFRPPLGWIFRALGGYPVERSESKNQVDMYVDLFRKHNEFAIVIAPEGTRKKVAKLKTGYYYIAKGAGIPIVPAIIDYPSRTVSFCDPFMPGEDELADQRKVAQYIASGQGKYPDLGYQLE